MILEARKIKKNKKGLGLCCVAVALLITDTSAV